MTNMLLGNILDMLIGLIVGFIVLNYGEDK